MYYLYLKDNFICEQPYSLPFEGIWTVVNGGVTEQTSHSWDIATQRYAYEEQVFFQLKENDSVYLRYHAALDI